MNYFKIFLLLGMLLFCFSSVASAQVEIVGIEREVWTWLHDIQDPGQSITLQEISTEQGLFDQAVELDSSPVLSRASQNTMTTDEQDQISISGQLGLALTQHDSAFEDGIQAKSSLESYFSVSSDSNYRLVGVASGSSQVVLELVHLDSGQNIMYDLVADTEYSFEGQLVAGDYFVTVWTWDVTYGGDLVDRQSSTEFNFTVALQGVVATTKTKLGGMKALFQ